MSILLGVVGAVLVFCMVATLTLVYAHGKREKQHRPLVKTVNQPED